MESHKLQNKTDFVQANRNGMCKQVSTRSMYVKSVYMKKRNEKKVRMKGGMIERQKRSSYRLAYQRQKEKEKRAARNSDKMGVYEQNEARKTSTASNPLMYRMETEAITGSMSVLAGDSGLRLASRKSNKSTIQFDQTKANSHSNQ